MELSDGGERDGGGISRRSKLVRLKRVNKMEADACAKLDTQITVHFGQYSVSIATSYALDCPLLILFSG